MRAFNLLNKARCDGCGRGKMCLYVKVYRTVVRLCATCVWNAARWESK